jgi:hypothetical protein
MTTDPPVDQRVPTMVPTVSPAARERVIALLTERYAQDHLTLDEFERRAAAAYAARSLDELAALTADLPAGEVPAARTSLPAGNVGVVLGSIVRDMHAVPRALDVRTVLGNVELDLTRASFAPGVTEISLHAFMGNIEIQLPPPRRRRGSRQRRPRLLRVSAASARVELGGEQQDHERRPLHRTGDDELRRSRDP